MMTENVNPSNDDESPDDQRQNISSNSQSLSKVRWSCFPSLVISDSDLCEEKYHSEVPDFQCAERLSNDLR